ncbi:long-chain-fatty-acid-CoA ligase [Mycena galericulata]|nr:long-chain-fatty-acid-CoA ligase [Mycena galericulata]
MSAFLAADALIPFPANAPYDKQSVPVPGTKRPGQTGLWGALDPAKHRIQTLADVFASGLARGKDRPFLGFRPIVSKQPLRFAPRYEWHSYGAVDVRRRQLGSALHHLFKTGVIGGGELETVGIWSINRPEWQMVEISLQTYKKVGVSLYDTLGKDSVGAINHAHLTAIFATVDHIPSLLKLAPATPLKLIISVDALSPELSKVFTEWGQVHGVLVKDIHEIEALGQANLTEPIAVLPTDIASICYTSGTTNMPKGVVITHRQFASSVVTNLLGLELPEDNCMLSYLPLAHIYERVNEMITTALSGRIGFSTNSPLRLLEDTQALRPHFFPGVPRVLNRLYQAAMAAADVPGLKGDLFRRAMKAKLERFRETGDNTHFFWDRVVFRKLRAVLGGNVMLISSGSAPISRDVVDFMNVAFSCAFAEETAAVATKCWPADPGAAGTVGPPQAATEIKLVDVPAMGYTADDSPNPRGEICARGPNCFVAYYKDEKNTRETVDEEGWVHTGDVAEIDACGRVKIIDRVKNIMKLAQGEYVALERIENTYSACPAVAQIYVHGDALQSYLVGVIIPDPVQLAAIAANLSGRPVAETDTEALEKACRDPRVGEHILGMLALEGNKNQLKGFESLKRIHVSLDAFSVEDGTMTPTFKVRRKDAYNKFKTQLDALYALGEPGHASATKL